MKLGWREGAGGDAEGGEGGRACRWQGALQDQARALLSFEWKGSHCLMGRGVSKLDVFTGWLWLMVP